MSMIMPFTWFTRIPGMSAQREAGRFALPGLVAAALLAGSAVDWLCHHARPLAVTLLALAGPGGRLVRKSPRRGHADHDHRPGQPHRG
jgi:hypothetical protein